MKANKFFPLIAVLVLGTPHVGHGQGQASGAFWNRVTNGLPAVEYYYTRSLGEPSESTEKSYTPALIGFHVKMQTNGLQIRFSDRIDFTNSHRIKESFHFAVGGFQSNIWSMGASKQITYVTVESAELSKPEPILRVVASAQRTGNSNAVSQPIAQKPLSASPVLKNYRAQREEARKVFHLGLPSLVRDSLIVSEDSFKAVTEAHGPIDGNLYYGANGAIERIEYRLINLNFRKQLVYNYESGNALPVGFKERTMSSRSNTMQITYKMLGPVRLPNNSFAPEELLPQEYYSQNADLRTFVEKDGQKFTVSAKGKLTPLQPKSMQAKSKSKTPILLVLGTICFVSVIVLVKQITKYNEKQTT